MKRSNSYIKLFISTFLLIFLFQTNTYSQDGTNFDFAYGTAGSYFGWKAYQAQNISSSSTISFTPWVEFTDPTTCTWTYYGTTDNCFVINSDLNAYDTIAGGANIKKIPTGYTRSTRINCPVPGANANMLTFDILLNDTNCLLTFNYALVIEAPGHSGYENPFFKIDIVRLNALEQENGLINSSATDEVIGQTPAPSGWGTFSGGIWQNWKQLAFNLKEYVNQKVRVKIILAACVPSGHFGYGYFVGKVATPELTLNYGNGDTIAVLESPSGFQKYEWFRATSAGMTETQMAAIAAVPNNALYTSTATATISANNKFNILNTMYATNGGNYFVKITSPSSSSTNPGHVSYIQRVVNNTQNINTYDTICYGDIYTNYGLNTDTSGIYTHQYTINDSNISLTVNLAVRDSIARPTNLVTNSTSEYIQLAWQGNASSYKIFRFDDLIGITNNTMFTDTNVVGGNNYCYKVTAIINNCESEFSNISCQTCLGLNTISTNDFNVMLYPNPTNDKTILNVVGLKEDADVIIYDLSGRKIKSYRLKQGQKELEIDVNGFSTGVYNINIINLNCNITKKLIIK
ncbi:MAG: T9SS type A sorting domain-containing protein [Bacteroidales bacterium]|jgi:hypothetical protein